MAYLLELIKALLYGIVFAVTEWLPAGSEAHILMLDGILPFELYPDAEMNQRFLGLFLPVLHLAAAGSAAALFYARLWPFSKRKSKEKKHALLRIWLLVLIPVSVLLIVSVLFGAALEHRISSPIVIAFITILAGAVLIISDRIMKKPRVFELKEMTLKETGAAGLPQLFALIPGVSRSGTAMIGGQLAGMNRTSAAELMCCLAIPSLLGTGLIKLAAVNVQWNLQMIPVLISGISGVFFMTLFTIRTFLGYLKTGGLHLFGYYRIIAGLVLLILALLGAVPGGLVY